LAVGKNCFCTRLNDAMAPMNAAAVTAIVVQRQVMHQVTSLRKTV
jgi:hypothetical protein